jgi:hypothetical protein
MTNLWETVTKISFCDDREKWVRKNYALLPRSVTLVTVSLEFAGILFVFRLEPIQCVMC